MRAYAKEYVSDVVENQGKLFDLVAQKYPDKDTAAFINSYMASKTRKSIDEAKAYVQQWNSQDLTNIDVNSPTWTKFAVFASDPENQAMLVSGGLLAKDLVQLAKATITNLSQGGAPFAIKSMQVGLRNPRQVDQLKNDMVSGNYKFTAPEGRIAGYVDSKGNYYISEGNHRMVAAQEIYKKTGDASYIEKLIQNGSWTQTKNAPAGTSSMPTRK